MKSFRVVNHHLSNVYQDLECQCPICRRDIQMSSLVLLRPADEETDVTEASDTPQAPSSTSDQRADAGNNSVDAEPKVSLAADDDSFAAVPLPRTSRSSLSATFPALSSRILTHIAVASGVQPGSNPVRGVHES